MSMSIMSISSGMREASQSSQFVAWERYGSISAEVDIGKHEGEVWRPLGSCQNACRLTCWVCDGLICGIGGCCKGDSNCGCGDCCAEKSKERVCSVEVSFVLFAV